MRRWLVIPLVVFLITAYSLARSDELTGEEIREARKLYTAKCARCHKLYDPAKYSDKAWREWMDKMSRKAKLKPDQKVLLSRYLETLRHGKGTNQIHSSAPPGH